MFHVGFFLIEASKFKSTFKLGLGEVECTLELALGIRMGNTVSSDSVRVMEEDIFQFIESDSFQILIAEEAADGIEKQGVREKRKRNVIQRCTNLWETNWG